ncbi:MAG: hypothetical protein O2955_14120 [Planctomycetota bacterium]|nr:hypothetical protein [Planctomycetota bacterium]
MTTPIIMLAMMVAPFSIACIWCQITRREVDLRTAAAVGLTVLFIFTGVGHFIQTEPMSQMLPSWVPERVLLVYLTGALEFTLAVGFMIRRLRPLTGWVAATILVLFFPANIYAALNQIPMGGHEWGPLYLLIRAPLQLAILLWVYWFTIKPPHAVMNPDARQAADNRG